MRGANSMLINSIEFIIFLSVLVIVYKLMLKKLKWIVLLIASYVFFALNSGKYTIFIMLSTLSIYITALKIDKIGNKISEKVKSIENKEEKKRLKNEAKKKKKIVLAIGILINIAMLVVLKYSGFIIGELNNLFKVNIPAFKFLLPLGISYYTLQAISYIVDVYRGKIKAEKNFGKVALFLAYFPQLIEGPIGRFDRLADQLYKPNEITYKTITYGSQLMLWGYFKKMVIADRVAMYVNYVFENYTEYTFLIIILAIVGYTLQIYAEFSGGIDIVRGASQIFGIELDKNFERPFFAKSIDEFWRRWNITLGAWLKEYIFYPVSLSKVSLKITGISNKYFKKSNFSKVSAVALSLFCVWLGNGIWHGAGWKYIVYGLYYYSIMMLGKIFAPLGDKLIKVFKIKTDVFSYKLWQILRTTGFVCIGMLIFRADNLKVAFNMFKSIFKVNHLERIFNGEAFLLGGIKVQDIIILIVSSLIMLYISIKQEKGIKIRETLAKQNILFRWIILYGVIFSIIIFGIYGEGYNVQSFIYGGF